MSEGAASWFFARVERYAVGELSWFASVWVGGIEIVSAGVDKLLVVQAFAFAAFFFPAFNFTAFAFFFAFAPAGRSLSFAYGGAEFRGASVLRLKFGA